ncbi:terpene synthase family protein [Streptomyces lasalocidi]
MCSAASCAPRSTGPLERRWTSPPVSISAAGWGGSLSHTTFNTTSTAYWLPDTVYCPTPYQALLWSAADIIMWTNDLVSYTREAASAETSNLALALQAELGLTLSRRWTRSTA